MFTLDNRVALITGAGRGLGRAQAMGLAAAGATVVVTDVDVDTAKQTAELIADAGGAAHPMALDVGDIAHAGRVLAEVNETVGPVRVLVNNAAITRRAFAIEAPVEDFDVLMDVNVKGLYFTAQAVARQMREAGGGSIVNLASIGGMVVDGPRSSLYDATKAAVIQLTRNLAFEWGRYGIRVNAIAPGYMRTEMVAEFLTDPAAEQAIIDAHLPIGRIGEPDDLAGPVVFLASDASRFVTGHTLNVDGGWVIS